MILCNILKFKSYKIKGNREQKHKNVYLFTVT